MKPGHFIFFIALLMSVTVNAFANEKKILFISASHSGKAKVTLFNQIAEKQAINVRYKTERSLGGLDAAKATFDAYDLVIFDGITAQLTAKNFDKYLPLIKDSPARFLPIAAPENENLRSGISKTQAQRLFDYYDNGGIENFSRMVTYLRQSVFDGKQSTAKAPIIYPKTGIYHPDYKRLVFDSLSSFQAWHTKNKTYSDRYTIGLMIPRAAIETAQTQIIDATIRQLEEKKVTAQAVFYETGATPEDYLALLQQDGNTIVDTFINFRSIHFANKRKEEFEMLRRPVIQALTYFDGDQKSWEESAQGISANMMAFTLVLPETAGVIDPIIVAAINEETGFKEVIDYQMDFLIARTLAYASLTQKPNADKKLTVMFWGDKDMGASFLNVPESLHTISRRLNQEGYSVEPHEHNYFSDRTNKILDPFFRDYQLDELLKEDLAELMPVSEYRQWLKTLPSKVVTPVTEFWGEPEDSFMVVKREGKNHFVIPRIRNGNMLIMRQPPRGDNQDQDQELYHTTTVPMNHYYLAAYYYTRKYWNSDAIIHLGTHGSQEWLPGKERGLSRYDGGNLSIGSTPVFYPYIIDDVGEAMQAKRRGGAVVLSHMTPPYAAAGLQDITADIDELINQYNALDDGGVKEKTVQQIVQICIDENLCKDFGWTEEKIDADVKGFLEALHEYLSDLAAENQPLGLHSFGELPEKNLVISTIVQMLGQDFTEPAGKFESRRYHQENVQPDQSETALELITGFKTVRDYVVNEGDHKDLDKVLHPYIETGRKYYQNMRNIQELDNLVIGLSGGYVPVKTGGDPIRHPDSLPTGLNLYGFDPSRLPTKAAYQQGEELVEQMIADFYKENGRYPEKMAFSLWSIEAMRHYGVLESQAMKAMGIKPVWSNDGRVVGTEIIPASELKRPRIDVVLSATGLYRDAFPQVMQRLAKAIQQIVELKEENNSIWKHSQKIKQELIAEGVENEEAQYLSTVRIFSSASGEYGSGVNGPVLNSDTWETDAKIADNYLNKMGYYFGADDSRWGKKADGLYGKQLSGTEIVAFSRSSNLFGMISSDDPFEYFGSLSLAVRNLDGKSPKVMISNLRDAKKGKMEDASLFLAKELRTRNFNRRWIEEMKKEGYSGAVTMASNLANFWGWQVVAPDLVRDDQWQEFFEVYVNDKLEMNMNEWFEQVNPGSQAQLLEQMLEAVRKDYWDADEETQKVMLSRYNELMSKYDLVLENEKLREFMTSQATGFGLNMQAIASASTTPPVNPAAASQQIEGQQLEKVEQTPASTEDDHTLLYILLGCLLAIIAGALRQTFETAPEPV